MHIRTTILLLPIILLAACAKPETSACSGDGVIAANAWLRAATEGQPMSAAYVELCNGGGNADRLVAVKFNGADAVELHQSSMSDDGIASMAPVEGGLELAPHAMTALAPGGAHIMLIGVTEAHEEGEEAAITLEFENAPPQTLLFEVRARNDVSEHGEH
jgi:copper(I)-binding protein